MLGFGASARDTIDKPAPIAKAVATCANVMVAKPIETAALNADAIPAMAETAMYLPQY